MITRLPTEILYEIGKYLDFSDLISLRLINKTFNNIFWVIMKYRIKSYLLQYGVSDVDLYNMNDISLISLLNILFFVRKHILSRSPVLVTINIINTMFKKYYYSTTTNNINSLEKLNLLLSKKLFAQVDYDRLQDIFLKIKIYDKEFKKMSDMRISDGINNTITFSRTDYDIIYESNYNICNKRENKYMITFHFFI